MEFITDALGVVSLFLDKGGPVLLLIGGLLFLMWTLIFERMFYFASGLKKDIQSVITEWEDRPERRSWHARRIREMLISQSVAKINQNMALIKTLVALAPMLGLLGTVTGMIEVFHVMAITGGGDPKSMAGGVSRATVPTMAGMVAAFSGSFAAIYLTSTSKRHESELNDIIKRDI